MQILSRMALLVLYQAGPPSPLQSPHAHSLMGSGRPGLRMTQVDRGLSASSLPIFLQWPGLDQAEARSWAPNPVLPRGWQDPNY